MLVVTDVHHLAWLCQETFIDGHLGEFSGCETNTSLHTLCCPNKKIFIFHSSALFDPCAAYGDDCFKSAEGVPFRESQSWQVFAGTILNVGVPGNLTK